jgi:hypothetical protein
MYELVQEISIDPLCLKPAMPLGRFCSTENYSHGFHGYITVFMSFLPYSSVHAVISMVTTA